MINSWMSWLQLLNSPSILVPLTWNVTCQTSSFQITMGHQFILSLHFAASQFVILWKGPRKALVLLGWTETMLVLSIFILNTVGMFTLNTATLLYVGMESQVITQTFELTWKQIKISNTKRVVRNNMTVAIDMTHFSFSFIKNCFAHVWCPYSH